MALFRSPIFSTILVIVSVILALVPAVARWWTGRRLAPDDPALPERLFARRTRDAQVAAFCIVGLLAFSWTHASWALPLLILARTAAGYPMRRRLLGETWSLPSYLLWTARLVVAVWGFWLLLAATPVLVHATSWRRAVALVLVAVLVLWHREYSRVLLWMLRARAMPESEWSPGFARVLDTARVAARPGVWRAGPPGARVANALALPSLQGSHVLFSETLLESLGDEERTAVLAHEVSHLELFTHRLLVQWRWTTLAVIAVGALVVPMAAYVPRGWYWFLLAWWPILVFLVLASRGRVIRAQETPSDRRAVELSGNAEAVITGLVKLHETAKLPRRWAMAHEQHATHPSLARRIQAIREAAGQSAAPVVFPVVIAGTDGTAVVIEAERVRHLAGVTGQDRDVAKLLTAASSAVSLPWSDVGELRVDARGGRPPRLLLADVRGQEWSVALDPAGIAGVQATLDTVDHKLPSTLPATAGAPRLARLAIATVCAALLVCFQWTAALLVAGLTLLKPNPQALLAAGVATLAASVIAASQASSSARLWLDLVPVAAAVWVLWLAWRWHRAGGPEDRLVHVFTGLAAVATWILVILYVRLDPFLLHLVARRTHALAVLPLAMAAGWAWSTEARFRRGAFAWLAIAAVAAAVSSTPWLDTIVRDPLRSGPEIRPVRARLVPIARSEVDLSASELWLSPEGRSFAVAPESPDEDEEAPLAFTVGTTGGALGIVDAYAVRLVDEDTLVTVERDHEQVSIKTRPVAAPKEATWSVPITGEPWGMLSVDAATRRWRLDQPVPRGLRILSGVIGRAAVDERTVASDEPRNGYVQWFATDADPIGQAYGYTQPSTMQTMVTALLQLPWRMPLALRFPHGGTVRSHFDGRCYEGRPGLPVACVARDGTRSHLWTWDGHGWRPAGSIPAEYVPQGRDASGWLAGWSRGGLLLVEPSSARALDVGGTCQRGECLTTATYTGRVLGGLVTTAGHVAASTYRVEPLTPR